MKYGTNVGIHTILYRYTSGQNRVTILTNVTDVVSNITNIGTKLEMSHIQTQFPNSYLIFTVEYWSAIIF